MKLIAYAGDTQFWQLSNREKFQNSNEYSYRRERKNKISGKQRQNQVHDIMTKNFFAEIIQHKFYKFKKIYVFKCRVLQVMIINKIQQSALDVTNRYFFA